ncbi:Uncharacterised protein [Rodentibacter pneumotropicus]|uniref:Uncharacterized protein n=1 Tax=Rodentibacter pneumotropicus TaxID=758 RepID=A0A3S4XUK4_9PAST|nr:Uncharacterised protein [Rodentibacter pneumotropicus]
MPIKKQKGFSMQNSLHPYAVDGTIIHGNTRENVVLLIYTHNAEIAENHIRIYAQQHQLRLSYQFRPQPFELYLQHHANPDFISPLTTLSTTLSENNPFIIFNPNQYQENEKSIDPSLTKETFLLREEDEYSPFLFQPIPRSMKLHLWQGNSESQCYAIVNAAVSFWFPRHFEVDGIRYECLFKGEEAENGRKSHLTYCICLKTIQLLNNYAVYRLNHKKMANSTGIKTLAFSSALQLILKPYYIILESLFI